MESTSPPHCKALFLVVGIQMTPLSLSSRGAQPPVRENRKADLGLRRGRGNLPLPLPVGWKGRYFIEDLPVAFQAGGLHVNR